MIKTSQDQQINSYFGTFFIIVAAIFLFSLGSAISKEVNNYESCKKVDGNWRFYNNNCADSCISQFNDFTPCVKRVVYGCDCGKNNCLYQNKCYSKFKFQETYEEIAAKKRKRDAHRRKKMAELAHSDPSYSQYIHGLFPKQTNPEIKKFKSNAQLVSEQFRVDNRPAPVEQKKKGKGAKRRTDPPISPSVNSQAVIKSTLKNTTAMPTVPQFYIDREKDAINPSAQKIPSSELDMAFPTIPIK